jgi:hypothetical protein
MRKVHHLYAYFDRRTGRYIGWSSKALRDNPAYIRRVLRPAWLCEPEEEDDEHETDSPTHGLYMVPPCADAG